MRINLFQRILASCMVVSLYAGFMVSLIQTAPVEAKGKMAPHAPGEVIVTFRNKTTDEDKARFYESIKATPKESLDFIKADVVKVNDERSLDSWIKIIKSNPTVKYAEPNFELSIIGSKPKNIGTPPGSGLDGKVPQPKTTSTASSTPSIRSAPAPRDPLFAQQWGLNNTGQNRGKAGADIQFLKALSQYTGRTNVIVAVIDTGVAYEHPDLAASVYVNPGEDLNKDGRWTKQDQNRVDNDKPANRFIDDGVGWNFVSNNANAGDDNGHGTHVAGIIAASTGNNLGVSGVLGNGRVKIMPLKFLSAKGSGYVSDAVKAIDYSVQKGARISNNSWGGSGYSQALYDAIQRAGQAGQLFIAAAGNSSTNIDTAPSYPGAFNLPNIITVASTDATDNLSSFSNFGAIRTHIAAPGSGIVSTYTSNRYATMSGTSMATPFVAGVAAMIWSQSPSLSAQQVRSNILSTARAVDSLNGKVANSGVLNASEALRASK